MSLRNKTNSPTKSLVSRVRNMYDNIVNINTYSSDEILIGKFLGKKLYRKVFEVDVANVTTGKLYNLDISDLKIERVIKNDAVCKHSGVSFMNFSQNAGTVVTSTILTTTTKYDTLATRSQTPNINTYTYIYIILEYTKTID